MRSATLSARGGGRSVRRRSRRLTGGMVALFLLACAGREVNADCLSFW